jgi:gliding motility-associated-like protein
LKGTKDKILGCVLLSVLLYIALIDSVNAQSDSIINKYARIVNIFNADTTDVDSVEVNNAQIFEPLDTVLFIVTKGATIFGPWNTLSRSAWGKINNWSNIGRYNILLVDTIIDDFVIFSTRLRSLHPSMAGEIAQLIKVRGGKDVYIVDRPLTCEEWNPQNGTGGVFALIAGRKIVLKSTIDVSGKGFLGGNPKAPAIDYFIGNCSEAVDSFYTEPSVNSSGRRGESVAYEGFPYTSGMLYTAHGGGGGNGKYSGGGGGGNYGQGGSGGFISEKCSPTSPPLGGKGYTISSYYKNRKEDLEWENRIFMGGGGGTSTQNPDSSRFATKGGNGGGIIILMADTIEAIESQTIYARGESVSGLASAGAGGGGGGGVIILEAVDYEGDLTFNVQGGNGGSTNRADDPTGPGGSGGGGVIWYRGNSISGVKFNVDNGEYGSHLQTLSHRGATNGTDGIPKSGLKIPLSGFLFNVMPPDQDICEGDTPSEFKASTPKGGTGTYSYQWFQSYDKINWILAPGVDTNKDYIPVSQYDTTYFRRIVTSGVTKDTSLILTINVLPSLENNNIAPNDTICLGSMIPELKDYPAYNIKGGNGTYKFSWLSSTNMLDWDTVPGKKNPILQDEIPLQTIYYRRIVNSHVCWDTSNNVKITVLPKISHDSIYSGSLLAPDDTICQGDNPIQLTGLLPVGGDNVYSYVWQSSLNKSSWSLTIPSNGQNFDPAVLTDTTYYRRIVISGSDDVCKDTSNMVTILVHPLISNNQIARDTIICMDNPNLHLTQLSGTVGGGDKMIYKYYWQSKVQSGSWQAAGNKDTLVSYSPGYIEDTTMYRRFIVSGACENYSNEIEVIVQDSILNNQIYSGDMIYPNDTICKDAIPTPLSGTAPTGGDIRYSLPSYQWESSVNGTSWTTIPGAGQSGYSPPSLSDTTYYRRKVSSGKCVHSSETVVIIVQSPITNNTIKNGGTDATCYETTLDLDGTAGIFEMTGGDRFNYAYVWQKSTNNLDWNSAPGINNLADYTTEELIEPAYFRRMVSSGACSNITGPTYVSINPRPTGEIFKTTYQTGCYDSFSGPVEVSIAYKLTGAVPFRIVSFDGFDYDTIENVNNSEGNFADNLTTSNNNDFKIEIYELTDGNGCVAYPDSLTGTVEMTVYKKPEINIVGGDGPIQVCGYFIQLEATQDVGTGYWVKAEGDETLSIDHPDQLNIQATIQHGVGKSKHYKLYRTGKNWPIPSEDICTSRDSVEVIFWKEPEPAYAGSKEVKDPNNADTTIYFADHMFMYADPPTAGSGIWTVTSGSANIENDTLYNTRINLGGQKLDEPSDFAFTWTVSNGTCAETSDEIKVARRDLRIYEGFSPDGNYINEYFTIEGLEYADTWDLKLFSRSGNLIRHLTKKIGETNPEENQLWDGTYDGGRPVESGIYYYILEVTKENTPYQYKGFVVIARERE